MKIGAAELYACQIGAIQNGVAEIRIGQVGTVEHGIGRDQAGSRWPIEIGTPRTPPRSHRRRSKWPASDRRPTGRPVPGPHCCSTARASLRTRQAGAGQLGADQHALREVGAGQIAAGEIGAVQQTGRQARIPAAPGRRNWLRPAWCERTARRRAWPCADRRSADTAAVPRRARQIDASRRAFERWRPARSRTPANTAPVRSHFAIAVMTSRRPGKLCPGSGWP